MCLPQSGGSSRVINRPSIARERLGRAWRATRRRAHVGMCGRAPRGCAHRTRICARPPRSCAHLPRGCARLPRIPTYAGSAARIGPRKSVFLSKRTRIPTYARRARTPRPRKSGFLDSREERWTRRHDLRGFGVRAREEADFEALSHVLGNIFYATEKRCHDSEGFASRQPCSSRLWAISFIQNLSNFVRT